MSSLRGYLIIATIILSSFIPCGCGGRPITATWFRHDNSYDIKGQQVTLRMLTFVELRDYAKNSLHPELEAAWRNRLHSDFPDVFPELPPPPAPGAPTATEPEAAALVALPVLFGFAVDFVKSELEREATLYEAQYGQAIHETGFWRDIVDKKGIPRWLGFEIVRRTAADGDNQKAAASRIVFAMIPADKFNRNQEEPADERLFVIKPLWLEVNRARAKASQFGPGTVSLAVNIRMNATWIDKEQFVHQDTVADAKFEVSGLGLKAPDVHIEDLENKIAGWFGGVPVSMDSTGTLKGNGTFQLAVSVTESDESQVREVIERAAKYLGDNRDDIVSKIGGG